MPAFYGICTTLESQYDIKQIQEYMLPSPPPSHPSRSESRNSSSSGDCNDDSTTKHGLKPSSPIEEVHVPIYPNSQFWLSYLVVSHMLQPAHSESSLSDEEVKPDKIKYVYFKLILPSSSTTNSPTNTDHNGLVNNGTNTIISWGVGAKEGWKGKTMFGLFKSSDSEVAWSTYRGRSRVDKRGFWFSGAGGEEGIFEVQVFRARARRRENRVFPEMRNQKGVKQSEVVNLVNTGKLKGHQPQRYYQYALLDAVDKPYVTFRYHLRSMDTLSTMGIFPQPLSNPMTPRFYCPTNEDTPQHHKSSLRRTRNEDDVSSVSSYASAEETQISIHEGEDEGEDEYDDGDGDGDEKACRLALSVSEHFHELSPSRSEHRHSYSRSLVKSEEEAVAEMEKDNRRAANEQVAMTNAFRRLSVPPTIRFVSSSSFNEPHSPSKDFVDDKEPVKEPFLQDSSSPSGSSYRVSSTSNGEYDVTQDIHGHEDAIEVDTAESGTLTAGPAADIGSQLREDVHHTLLRRVRAREGLEVARRNFILRTPSPATYPCTDASVENGGSEKEKDKFEATPPGSGRRIGRSGFLKGVLESALGRRADRIETKTGGDRCGEEDTCEGRGGKGGSGEEKKMAERKSVGETKGMRSRYEAVRNSF